MTTYIEPKFRKYFLLSERERNAEKMCAQCEHLVNGECEHPVIMNRNGGKVSYTHLIYMSNDGKMCQIFRKECVRCVHYHEEQVDVDRWREYCDLDKDDIEFDYRKYCPHYERDPEAME